MARAARRVGTIVTADIDNVYEGVQELLPLIDVLITSAEFPNRLLGIPNHREGILELKNRFGCAVVGITLGRNGALIFCDGQFIGSEAFEVPGGCRDTTGAGDAFHAGFIYGMLRDADLESCLKLGNAVAALKCRALGARTALPTARELDDFILPGWTRPL
jgi:sugar/nucleoside kinase (ribokinase family)